MLAYIPEHFVTVVPLGPDTQRIPLVDKNGMPLACRFVPADFRRTDLKQYMDTTIESDPAVVSYVRSLVLSLCGPDKIPLVLPVCRACRARAFYSGWKSYPWRQ